MFCFLSVYLGHYVHVQFLIPTDVGFERVGRVNSPFIFFFLIIECVLIFVRKVRIHLSKSFPEYIDLNRRYTESSLLWGQIKPTENKCKALSVDTYVEIMSTHGLLDLQKYQPNLNLLVKTFGALTPIKRNVLQSKELMWERSTKT